METTRAACGAISSFGIVVQRKVPATSPEMAPLSAKSTTSGSSKNGRLAIIFVLLGRGWRHFWRASSLATAAAVAAGYCGCWSPFLY